MTRDVQSKTLPSGSVVADFSIAVTDRYKDRSDKWVEKTTFIELSAFGRTAEVAAQYLAKGSPVMVDGRLDLEQWEDKNGGGKRSKLKVIVEKLQLLGQKGEGGQSRQTSSQPAARKQTAASSQPYGEVEYGTDASGDPPSQAGLEDVPF